MPTLDPARQQIIDQILPPWTRPRGKRGRLSAADQEQKTVIDVARSELDGLLKQLDELTRERDKLQLLFNASLTTNTALGETNRKLRDRLAEERTTLRYLEENLPVIVTAASTLAVETGQRVERVLTRRDGRTGYLFVYYLLGEAHFVEHAVNTRELRLAPSALNERENMTFRYNPDGLSKSQIAAVVAYLEKSNTPSPAQPSSAFIGCFDPSCSRCVKALKEFDAAETSEQRATVLAKYIDDGVHPSGEAAATLRESSA